MEAVEEFELVEIGAPYRGVKQTNKYDYFGLFVNTVFRGKETGIAKGYTEMLQLHRIKERDHNKYKANGELKNG